MKRSRLITGMLSLLAAIPVLSGCGGDDAPSTDRTHFDTYDIYIRFESASGTNLIDSLNLTNHGVFYEIVDPKDNGLVQVSCVRETDGKQMEFCRFAWMHPILEGLQKELVEAGSMLEICWGEFYDDDLGRRPDYDEVYTVRIKSHAIFGSDEEHTIKWYSHIIGKIYDCYRCEIDGEEYAFTETEYYSYLRPIKTPGYYITDKKEVGNVIINLKKGNIN